MKSSTSSKYTEHLSKSKVKETEVEQPQVKETEADAKNTER